MAEILYPDIYSCIKSWHKVSNDNLVISQSIIHPKAGLGIYTMIDIPAFTHIADYIGVKLHGAAAFKSSTPDSTAGAYRLKLGPGCILDAKDDLTILARYFNDGGCSSSRNCRFIKFPEHEFAAIVTTKLVPAGSELLVDYGSLYWEACARNGHTMSIIQSTPCKDEITWDDTCGITPTEIQRWSACTVACHEAMAATTTAATIPAMHT